jgi:predicted DNA binding CopG/RHH family protein
MKKLKKLPKFKSEAEERKFWLRADSTQYVDYSKPERWVFPNLKLSSKPITIRLPESLINRFKVKANQLDVPYQSLMKQALAKGIMLL